MWAMRLSRQGYGDIVTIKNLDVKTFLDLIHYENYLSKYDTVLRELNKRGKG
jgi:hypothetical protein